MPPLIAARPIVTTTLMMLRRAECATRYADGAPRDMLRAAEMFTYAPCAIRGGACAVVYARRCCARR